MLDSLVMILLDEMNLAHPELYFAEFLSKRFDVQLLVPAERIRESVSMKVANWTVQSVAEKVGLVIGPTAK